MSGMSAGGAAPTSRGGPVRGAWSSAFRHRDFKLFQTARLASILGMQMQSVAIGWQIYGITRRPIDLAWVGLVQFLPAVGLSLVTGQTADRFDRRTILLACHAAMASTSVALFVVARSGQPARLAWIYGLLAGVGVARAFLGPANQSILPSLVSVDHFGNAVAWGSSLMQTAMVVGPAVGGFIYAAGGGPGPVYAASAAGSLAALLLVRAIPSRPGRARRHEEDDRSIAGIGYGAERKTRPPSLAVVDRSSILAGVRYVWSNPIVLGAISLDLFAVLLGGATALLPIYARDVLHLGPRALGVLRSAPAAGAAATGVALALRPIRGGAGIKMLGCVALFGVATLAFGLSRSFVLSLLALIVAGAGDMVSVFVRSALVQLAPPDAMRGRVSAVNMVFIGASNELGEFESGITAQWWGAVPSVVVGAVGTLIVVAVWAWRFPQLRRVDRLTDVMPEA
jgi:MFS family permease